MRYIRRFSILITILTCFLQAQGADKYTDENRPYEFGFTIDGEQHRHEKKDENGLIMGEFGFITADGVYHVTVYATDENGNFKILSMKNIRVRPYPTAPDTRQGHSLALPPEQAAAQTPAPEQQPISIEPPARSCSHCSIPTTSTLPPPPPPPAINEVYPNEQAYTPEYPPYNPEQSQQNYPEEPQQTYPEQPYPEQPYPVQPQENYPEQPGQEYPQEGSPQYPEQGLQTGERNPKAFDIPPESFPAEPPTTPVLVSAQMQIVDRNTDINRLGPGEKAGLPNGLKKDDMEFLLYTFNYTVGFHGHYEEGYKSGAKKGYYFVTGRNGVRTRVDYEADENGFRPRISQEVLDLLSEDVPKEETEKDPKYGLKGYEFKWIYYPVDQQRR